MEITLHVSTKNIVNIPAEVCERHTIYSTYDITAFGKNSTKKTPLPVSVHKICKNEITSQKIKEREWFGIHF